MSDKKEYLGDGCYVEYQGDCVVLTTSNGVQDTNRIVLEHETYTAFERFMARLKEKKA
jgi:hypothetical protein